MSREQIKRKAIAVSALALVISGALSVLPANSQSFLQAVNDYNAGRYARALGEFKEFSAAYPQNALCHYYIALCSQALGHVDKAKTEYQWVISNGDARLKGMATTGLGQLANIKTQLAFSSSTTSASSGSSSGSPSSTSAPRPRVKKILEFYADW